MSTVHRRDLDQLNIAECTVLQQRMYLCIIALYLRYKVAPLESTPPQLL
jgi:hypothetical protein